MAKAFSLYICDRSKECLYHRDWIASTREASTTQRSHDFITTYGLCFQMKLFTTAADPTKAIGMSEGCKADGMRPTPIGEGTEFRSLCTNTYQLHFLEMPSGIKIILNTTPYAGSMQDLLRSLYLEVYVALCCKDPTHVPGQKLSNPCFDEEIDSFFRRHRLL